MAKTTSTSGSLAWSGTEIPSLYGLRGIAAMIVVISHLGVKAFNANYAVICFFVLSGFLITHLLLKEYDKTGDISLHNFYIRRALRIFPAFYGYATCYVLGRIVVRLRVDWATVVSCLTYTSNYYFAFSGHPLATMVHTWSLAVEEQFYLICPFIVWRFGANRARLMKGLMGTIIAVWIYRWVATLLGFNGTYVFGAFETRADGLALGCLLAVANRERCLPQWLIDTKWLAPLAIAVVCGSSALQLNGPRYAWALVALGFAVLLIQSIAHAQTLWYSFLSSRPLYALGVISYSLYLYHPFANRLPGALHKLPIGIAFAVALATASYWIVEKPFLALKDRLSKAARPVATEDSAVACEQLLGKNQQ
jgi:peptidoglycan/LPS O-acetylase OafA/YrhL